MVFKRKPRKVIRFEFEKTNKDILAFETVHSSELADKLIEIGEIDQGEMSLEEAQELYRKAFNAILGKGAMDKIQEEVYGGDKLLSTDYLDIGIYLFEQIDKANKELDKAYGNFSEKVEKLTDDEPVDGIIVDEK